MPIATACGRSFPQGEFLEIYVKCPIEVCEMRDVKGLYRRARAGKIDQFTGISSPYEEPLNPDLVLETQHCHVNDCVDRTIGLLRERGILSPSAIAARQAEAGE